MSYLVIARKYRPLFFRDVIGQEHITKTLSNAIITKHIAQGYLFTGTRGVGKTTSARIFAKALNCEKGLNPEPCNECSNCISITNGQNVDVFEIDGASNRGINEIRELRSTIKFKPMISRYKIYIIDEVHMITTEGFNALLKTLEEPPDHAIFIFATTDLHKVPETIISRCQLYQFRKLNLDEITFSLKGILQKENIKYEDEAVLEIAKLADGSLRDSQSLLDQALSFSSEKLTLEAVREVFGITPMQLLYDLTYHLFECQKLEAFEIMRKIINAGYDLNQFIKDYIQFLRDLLIQKNIKSQNANFINSIESNKLTELSQKISSNKIILIIEELLKLLQELKTTTFTTTLVEISIFKLFRIIEMIDIEELSNYLKKLNLALSGGNIQNKLTAVIQPDAAVHSEIEAEPKKNIDRLDKINNIEKPIINETAKKIEDTEKSNKSKTSVSEKKEEKNDELKEIAKTPSVKMALEFFGGELVGVKKTK
ncbi:MAG TPA: DNA polymerase III subunit gamma/tau [bacterium]|nr:DNA polymerase III subunit gamma/tau [bacterium]